MAGDPLHCACGMQALDTETVKDYLAQREQLAAHLGPSDTKSDWQVCPQPPANCSICTCCLSAWQPRWPFITGSRVLQTAHLQKACMGSETTVSSQCSSTHEIVCGREGGGGEGSGRCVNNIFNLLRLFHMLRSCSKHQPDLVQPYMHSAIVTFKQIAKTQWSHHSSRVASSFVQRKGNTELDPLASCCSV